MRLCRATEAEHILGFKSPVGNEWIAVQRNASWSEKSLIADRRSMTAWAVWGAQMDASMFLSKERSLKTTNLRNLRLLRRRRYRSPCPGVVVIVHDGFRRLIVLNLFAASKERASCCEHFLETDNRWLLSEARIHGDGGVQALARTRSLMRPLSRYRQLGVANDSRGKVE